MKNVLSNPRGSHTCSLSHDKPLKQRFSEPELILSIEQSPRQNTCSLSINVSACVFFLFCLCRCLCIFYVNLSHVISWLCLWRYTPQNPVYVSPYGKLGKNKELLIILIIYCTLRQNTCLVWVRLSSEFLRCCLYRLVSQWLIRLRLVLSELRSLFIGE